MQNSEKLKSLFIIEDHSIVREGLKKVFTRKYGFNICGEAQTLTEASACLSLLKPDLILLDQQLPDGLGSEAAGDLQQTVPKAKIVLLTGFPVHEYIAKGKESAVARVLFKSLDAATLRQEVMDVLRLEYPSGEKKVEVNLSPREKEIMGLLATGLLNKEIAGKLSLSEKTIRNTISGIFFKLGVGNRTEAALLWRDTE